MSHLVIVLILLTVSIPDPMCMVDVLVRVRDGKCGVVLYDLLGLVCSI